jgi:hypothetical protein
MQIAHGYGTPWKSVLSDIYLKPSLDFTVYTYLLYDIYEEIIV